jgi:general L-amino acid transport system permease protein
VIWTLVDFLLLRAVWIGTGREDCLGPEVGACWPFIWAKMNQFIYGFYPAAERWRPDLVFFFGAALLIPLAIPWVPHKRLNAILFFGVYPVISYFLLVGGVFGMPLVGTRQWGGLLVTLVVAVTGIVASLPLGILLALGRRSRMPLVRLFSVIFIEFWRGVPLITLLFMASFMLPCSCRRG